MTDSDPDWPADAANPLPSDTEPPGDDALPSPPAPAEDTRPLRRDALIDLAAGAVVFTERRGGTPQVFDLASLPAEAARYVALSGLRFALRTGESPAEAYAALCRGELPHQPRQAPAPKPLDPWREAVAHALADDAARQAGTTAKKFGKLTPEYLDLLGTMRDKARRLDQAGLRKVKRVPAVVAHHHRLTGADTLSLESLVA